MVWIVAPLAFRDPIDAIQNKIVYRRLPSSERRQIEDHTTMRQKVSTPVDLPLSNEYMRVLFYAAEDADRLSHKHLLIRPVDDPLRVDTLA
jgi:hypothetical protein